MFGLVAGLSYSCSLCLHQDHQDHHQSTGCLRSTTHKDTNVPLRGSKKQAELGNHCKQTTNNSFVSSFSWNYYENIILYFETSSLFYFIFYFHIPTARTFAILASIRLRLLQDQSWQKYTSLKSQQTSGIYLAVGQNHSVVCLDVDYCCSLGSWGSGVGAGLLRVLLVLVVKWLRLLWRGPWQFTLPVVMSWPLLCAHVFDQPPEATHRSLHVRPTFTQVLSTFKMMIIFRSPYDLRNCLFIFLHRYIHMRHNQHIDCLNHLFDLELHCLSV